MTERLGGRYRIQSRLGAGEMGEVVLADDTHLRRQVAIKVLHADHETDAVARERLRREAHAAAALDHPFICRVYDIGNEDDRTFIVMEYVDGETRGHQTGACEGDGLRPGEVRARRRGAECRDH